jgi:hypothetical protein
MSDSTTVLFICEKYYLRFYRPLAERLVQFGFSPVWVTLDGAEQWDYDYLDPGPAIERLTERPELQCRPSVDALCALERTVFERPDVFRNSYPYTINVVRTFERARRLAEVWSQATLALVARFQPRGVFVWNGRYLPYSAISAACEAAGQPFFTSEIGWLPGTIFLDRGRLSADTTDLFGRGAEAATTADEGRAEAFLTDYTAKKATMVSQRLLSPSETRRNLLGAEGRFLLVYGCQVDWDTNVVIGARRFHSNESAISFLLECIAGVPGARIVVKTHPLDSKDAETAVREIVGSRGTVVSDIHPHTLIEAADCVSVRNSTLGFEALCYAKPLIALEHAKYCDPKLTLTVENSIEGGANLQAIAAKRCTVPDRLALRQFMLHALDHYLVPVGYRYFFEPDQLAILAHLERNDSYRQLHQVLCNVAPASVDADPDVVLAIGRGEFHRARRRSFLRRITNKLVGWRF